MAVKALQDVLDHLRLGTFHGSADRPDAELLKLFLSKNDQGAFAELVHRHGRMVLGVCRRVLGHVQDAEDAFQATFLLLARKAGSIAQRKRLAGWLYTVAYRAALEARARRSKRQANEMQVSDMPEPTTAAREDQTEIWPILDQELNQLPEKYRDAIVLCDLQGLTRKAAARQLAIKEGTLSSRLATARRLLAARLERKGITLSATALAAILSADAASATVSASLTASTVRLVQIIWNGPATASAGASVDAIAKGVMKAMLMSKLKSSLLVALIALVPLSLIAVAGQIAMSDSGKNGQERKSTPRAVVQRSKEETKHKRTYIDQFGDSLPAGAVARLGTMRFRHGGAIIAIALSPDTKKVATAGLEGYVHIWDRKTGKELQRWSPSRKGFDAAVKLAFLPDGNRLAIAKVNSPAELWDIDKRKKICDLSPEQCRVKEMAFSPDGKIMAYSCWSARTGKGETSIHLAEAATGKELRMLTGHEDKVLCLSFSRDGKFLASGSNDKTICIWEVNTGKRIQKLTGHAKGVVTVAFSPQGKWLISTSSDQTLRRWNLATGKQQNVHRFPELSAYYKQFNLAPLILGLHNDKTILVQHAGKVYFLNATTCKQTRQLKLPEYGRSRAELDRFSPNPKFVAYARDGDRVVYVCDLSNGHLQKPLAAPEYRNYFLSFSPDSRYIASANLDSAIRIWHARTGKMIRRLPKFGPIAFAPDGKTLISGGWNHDGKVYLWNWHTGKMLREFRAYSYMMWSLAVSPDGKTLVTQGHDKDDNRTLFRLWDLTTGQKLHEFEPVGQIIRFGVKFSPHGRHIAIASRGDNTVRIWDTHKKRLARKLTCEGAGTLTAFALSPNGKTVATAHLRNRTITVWDIKNGRELRRWRASNHLIDALAFSPDGRTLVSADQQENFVRVWEVATGGERYRWLGHQGPMDSLAFSPDGRLLATGSTDTTVLIWDATGRSRIANLPPLKLTEKNREKVWRDLASEDAKVGYAAIEALMRDPASGVVLLQKHLQSVNKQPAQRVEFLLKQLGSEKFRIRSKANAELQKMGEAIEDTLRKALQKNLTLETHQRIKLLLDRITGNRPRRLRILRGIEALEHTDTHQTQQLLQQFATGAPEAFLTQQAKAALKRLGQ